MTTKTPQRPKQPKQQKHGPRPYGPEDENEVQEHNSRPGTEPFALPPEPQRGEGGHRIGQ